MKVYVITGIVGGKKVIFKVTNDLKISIDLVDKYKNYNNVRDVKAEVCDYVFNNEVN